MNKIEDILDNLIQEFPEMLEQKGSIRKLLLSMEQNNPDITIDSDFKQALKNKLEVQNYAKLKNTQNKKINIAQKGAMSFKKDNKNIFKKPSLNFIKILSPIFAGAFALFGFFHFFGDNLFEIKSTGELEYKVEKTAVQEITNKEPIPSTQNQELGTDSKGDEIETASISNNKTEETNISTAKMTIAEKIAKRNALNKVKNTKKKLKEEEDFTKKLIGEMGVEKKVEEIKEKKPLLTTPQGINEEKNETTIAERIAKSNKNKQVKRSENKLQEEDFTKKFTGKMGVQKKVEESKEQLPTIKTQTPAPSEVETDDIQNTEIIDILGDEDALEGNVEGNEGMSFSDASAMTEDIAEDGIQAVPDLEQNIPEGYYVDEDLFQKFCDEKNGIMKDNICTYGEVQCSKEDFIKNKCVKK